MMIIVLVSSPVHAEEDERLVTAAQVHDQRAMERFEAGDYAEALEEMEAAHLVLPSTPRLYNMARCHERLEQPQEAIELYQQFLASNDAPSDRRRAVEERLAVLQPGWSRNVSGTSDENQPTLEQTHAVGETDEGTIDGHEEPPAVDSSRRRLSPVAFYSVLAVAALSGVALAALGSVTLREYGEFLDLDRNDPAAPNEAARGDQMTLASNVLLGVTCATATAAVILAVFTRWSRREQARLQVTTSALRDGAALELFGRF